MKPIINGKIFFCEDYVNTDVIAPGRFDPVYEEEKLAEIALIDYQGVELFVDKSKNRTHFPIIIAGESFGCGSSRETAPMALAFAGLKVIVARSFSRIFFRNCINFGQIHPVIINHNFGKSVHGEKGIVDFNKNTLKIGSVEKSFSNPPVLQEIFEKGGLGQYLKEKGEFWLC